MISIIVPVYNAEKYVEKAIKSALQQPETGEVILIEDGSNDNSLKICKKLAREYKKVRLLTHEGNKNLGASASRNLGITHARHQFIAFLDADDYYLENRFRLDTLLFKKDDSIDGVYGCTGIEYENEKLRREWIHKREHEITTIERSIPPQHLFRSLLFCLDGCFSTDAITVKKELFGKTGLFDENLILHQDTAMWIKMAAVGKLVAGEISTPIAIRRVHEENRITKIDDNDFRSADLLYNELSKWAKINLYKKQQELIKYKIWRNVLFGKKSWGKIKKNNNNSNLKSFVRIIALNSNNKEIFFSKYFIWLLRDLIIEKIYKKYSDYH